MKKPGPRLGGPDLKSVNRFSAAATQDQAKEAQPEQRGSGRLRNCRILNLQPVPGIEPSLRLVSSGDHSCGVGDDPGRVPVEFGVVGKRVAKDCERRFVNRSRSGLGLPKQDQVIEPARCQSRNLLSDAGAGGRGACRPSAIIKDKMIRAQRLTRAVKRVHNLSIGKRGAARVVTKADGGRISVSVGHVRNAWRRILRGRKTIRKGQAVPSACLAREDLSCDVDSAAVAFTEQSDDLFWFVSLLFHCSRTWLSKSSHSSWTSPIGGGQRIATEICFC